LRSGFARVLATIVTNAGGNGEVLALCFPLVSNQPNLIDLFLKKNRWSGDM
jgi:hypothetical protein